MSAVEIRNITAAETIDIRHAVLRAGLPREAAIFPSDALPEGQHFGAFLDEKLGAVASIAPAVLGEQPQHPGAWQLRGMAALESCRGQGLASALFVAASEAVKHAGGSLLWCNARIGAVGFYVRVGMRIVSEEFDIPTAGPHVRMAIDLPPATAISPTPDLAAT
jgi:GNAT superfamily N-acetyltransferase